MFPGINIIAIFVNMTLVRFSQLQKSGYRISEEGRGFRLILPYDLKEKRYFIPSILKGLKYELFLEGFEAGYHGRTKVICGLNGESLLVVRSEQAPQEKTFHFRKRDELVTVAVEKQGPTTYSVKIYLHKIIASNYFYKLESKLLYEGLADLLPLELVCFEKPIQAAINRCNQSGNHRIFYSAS